MLAATITLRVIELCPDENSEVVVESTSGVGELVIKSPFEVAERGVLGRHVTAQGDDVSGFGYVRFKDGVRIIFPMALRVATGLERITNFQS